jgi:hypothetical protein
VELAPGLSLTPSMDGSLKRAMCRAEAISSPQ